MYGSLGGNNSSLYTATTAKRALSPIQFKVIFPFISYIRGDVKISWLQPP